MRALLALAVVVPVCMVAAYVVRSQTWTRRREMAPTHDLATAVRLLDRAAACDDVMPYMSTEVRDDVRAFLAQYHKMEIS